MTRKAKRRILIVLILVVAVGAAALLGRMKPPPEKKELAQVDILVDVLPLESTTVSLTIESQGSVRPRTETIVSAEVSGPIVSVSPKFIAGGVFAKGEELLRIDPTNYRVAVDQAEALLKQREIEFKGAEKLRTQGYRAEAEWASAAAALAAASAELVKARRNLERTSIRLPYAGMVRSKEADVGQFVNPGSRLGVTFATDYAEVRLPLTDRDLAFIDLPDAKDIAATGAADGPAVRLSATQRGRMVQWDARITRTEGVVDERSRVTYAVARVEDPYLLNGSSAAASLPIGTFVAARIEGRTVEDVIRVPRAALRGSDQLLFVDEDNRLRIRSVDILRADADAYLRGGAEAGDRITMTAIESPINGMRVRTGDEPAGDLRAGDEEPGDADQLAKSVE